MNEEKEEKQKKYKVKIASEKESGSYTNAISVHVNSNECIIDFGYSVPNSPEPTIKVVERINMSHRTAESFLNVFSNAILDWKNKNKNKQEDENK